MYFAVAVTAVALLNALLWMPVRHHGLSAALASVVSLHCGVSIVICFNQARRINDLVPAHRAHLQRERYAIECELGATELRVGPETDRRVRDLRHARRLLKTADETIHFEEVECDPAALLGVPASAGAIGTVLSLLIGGFALAWEAYINGRSDGWDYDAHGFYRQS